MEGELRGIVHHHAWPPPHGYHIEVERELLLCGLRETASRPDLWQAGEVGEEEGRHLMTVCSQNKWT